MITAGSINSSNNFRFKIVVDCCQHSLQKEKNTILVEEIQTYFHFPNQAYQLFPCWSLKTFSFHLCRWSETNSSLKKNSRAYAVRKQRPTAQFIRANKAQTSCVYKSVNSNNSLTRKNRSTLKSKSLLKSTLEERVFVDSAFKCDAVYTKIHSTVLLFLQFCLLECR